MSSRSGREDRRFEPCSGNHVEGELTKRQARPLSEAQALPVGFVSSALRQVSISFVDRINNGE
jgi:hypothetical protein